MTLYDQQKRHNNST